MEIKRFGEFVRKCARSCVVVVVPPRSNCGMILRVDGGKTGRVGVFSSSSPYSCVVVSDGRRCAADGAWNARRERRTVWIWVASSLSTT